MPQVNDYCKGCRAFYKAIIGLLARNNIVAILFVGTPIYILIALAASQIAIYSVYSSIVYTILAILCIAWILGTVCILRVYPNLLTISIFIYNCIAHWSLVSVIIMIFYGWKYVPSQMLGQILGTLFPLILSLFVAGDVLVECRRNLFTSIDNFRAQAIAEQSFSTGEAKEGV